MARKTVLALAGAMVTGLALAGCQNNNPRPGMYSGGTKISQNTGGMPSANAGAAIGQNAQPGTGMSTNLPNRGTGSLTPGGMVQAPANPMPVTGAGSMTGNPQPINPMSTVTNSSGASAAPKDFGGPMPISSATQPTGLGNNTPSVPLEPASIRDPYKSSSTGATVPSTGLDSSSVVPLPRPAQGTSTQTSIPIPNAGPTIVPAGSAPLPLVPASGSAQQPNTPAPLPSQPPQ
jgi:hypothetical protein